MESSRPLGDVACPACGSLLWADHSGSCIEATTRVSTRSIPKSTLLFAVLCVVAGLASGAVWYLAVSTIEEFHPLDAAFYFKLYSAIGGVSGLFAWYVATLVARDRIQLRSAVITLACPFTFIFFLSLDVFVIVLFVFAMLPLYMTLRAKETEVTRRC
jgi:MFS family permease